jgi:hypothetical protein
MSHRSAALAIGVVCLAAVMSACSDDESAPVEQAWEADLEGYVEWEPDDVCADRNADSARTTTIADGTMGDLGATSAVFHHCFSSEDGNYYDGEVTFTTEDGDELWAEYDDVTDSFAADPLSWPMEITGGTGRFADASGTVYLMSFALDWGEDPPGWSAELEGTISN